MLVLAGIKTVGTFDAAGATGAVCVTGTAGAFPVVERISLIGGRFTVLFNG
jgi:hypothetical protein